MAIIGAQGVRDFFMAKRIGQLFDRVAGKAFAGHGGPLMVELCRVWDALCPEIAAFARPDAVKRAGPGPAVLKLKVAPGRALEVQMMEPVLIERINGHFGRAVIGRVKMVQAGVPATAQATEPQEALPEPDAALLASLTRGLGNVRDENLRAALQRVAEGIARKAAAARSHNDSDS